MLPKSREHDTMAKKEDAIMREKLLFNSGWSFHYGELPTEAPLAHISCYRHSKSFHRDGVHDPNYTEVNWSNYIKNGKAVIHDRNKMRR